MDGPRTRQRLTLPAIQRGQSDVPGCRRAEVATVGRRYRGRVFAAAVLTFPNTHATAAKYSGQKLCNAARPACGLAKFGRIPGPSSGIPMRQRRSRAAWKAGLADVGTS